MKGGYSMKRSFVNTSHIFPSVICFTVIGGDEETVQASMLPELCVGADIPIVIRCDIIRIQIAESCIRGIIPITTS